MNPRTIGSAKPRRTYVVRHVGADVGFWEGVSGPGWAVWRWRARRIHDQIVVGYEPYALADAWPVAIWLATQDPAYFDAGWSAVVQCLDHPAGTRPRIWMADPADLPRITLG